MKFRVLIGPPALADAIAVYEYLLAHSPQAADKWIDGLLEAVSTLEVFPRRCARARESTAFKAEVRQLRFKSHRVIYSIIGNEVRILHIRHAAQSAKSLPGR